MNCGGPPQIPDGNLFHRGASKLGGPKKLTFSSIVLVIFSRFWEWTRPLAGWETGVALAKLRWIRRRRVAKNRRPEREIGVGE